MKRFVFSTFIVLVGGLHSFAEPHVIVPNAEKATRLVLDIEKRGKIVIDLKTKTAPKTCARIIKLTKDKFYDGQKFFRVVRQPRPFLVQFGDPQTIKKPITDPDIGSGFTDTKIPYEDSGFKHAIGAVGLVRSDREDKDSGDCQFYIMLGNYSFLDGNYTVFGQVVEGLKLLDSVELGDKVTKATIVEVSEK